MDKKNKNIQEMRKMGFSQKTLSLLNESQIAVLLEKIKKEESKEATVTTKTVLDKTIAADVRLANYCLQNRDDAKCKNVEIKEAETITTTTKKIAANEPLKDMTPSQLKKAEEDKTAKKNPDGSIEITTTKKEVGESKKKKKKYNPWAVCTAQVGREDKDKYEKCVMGVKKKLKEGRNPYEYLIESKMEEIVEKHLTPKMTKFDLMKLISEKQMEKPIGKMMSTKGETTEGETKTKEKEKVTTQPKIKPPHPAKNPSKAPHPAKAMMMKKETMEGETETETAPVRTTPAEPKTRPSHPGKKPNPDTELAPAKAEKKKEEIINAIAKLIGKGK